MIIVQSGDIKVMFEKSDLGIVNETGEGIVLEFRGGSRFVFEDPNLPIITKRAIKFALDGEMDNFKINLKNYLKPISISLEK